MRFETGWTSVSLCVKCSSPEVSRGLMFAESSTCCPVSVCDCSAARRPRDTTCKLDRRARSASHLLWPEFASAALLIANITLRRSVAVDSALRNCDTTDARGTLTVHNKTNQHGRATSCCDLANALLPYEPARSSDRFRKPSLCSAVKTSNRAFHESWAALKLGLPRTNLKNQLEMPKSS